MIRDFIDTFRLFFRLRRPAAAGRRELIEELQKRYAEPKSRTRTSPLALRLG